MNDGLHAKLPHYDAGTIISLKFITDNNQMLEAVGEYVGQTADELHIKHLQAIVPQQDPKTGQMSVGFMNYMLSGDPDSVITIHKHTVMATSPSKKEVIAELEKLKNPSAVTVPKPNIIT